MKKQHKDITKYLFFIAVILAIVSFNQTAVSAQEPTISLRLGENAPKNSPADDAVRRFASLAAEKTNGHLTVKIYPANQLGSNRNLISQVSIGGLDMAMLGLGSLGYIYPPYNFMQVPFLFHSQDQLHDVLHGKLGKRLKTGILDQRNIRVLAQDWDQLPRQICSSKPITNPTDFRKVLIRTGSEGSEKVFKLLGAKPTSIPLKGVYLALQNNVVSAVDLPVQYIYFMSLYEVCPYLDLINHTYGSQALVINNLRYRALPADYKKVLQESAIQAGEFNNQEAKAAQKNYVKKLREKGMKVVQVTPRVRRAFEAIVKKNIRTIEQTWSGDQGFGKIIFNTDPATTK